MKAETSEGSNWNKLSQQLSARTLQKVGEDFFNIQQKLKKCQAAAFTLKPS